jgi:hypothetical protein
MLETIAKLNHLYERFNARDVEAVLAAMQPDVQWANSTDGGHLVGHDAVRAYWTRQWADIAPILTPEHFSTDALGRVVIEGRLRVRDKSGALLADGRVKHAYTFKDGLVQRMDVL